METRDNMQLGAMLKVVNDPFARFFKDEIRWSHEERILLRKAATQILTANAFLWNMNAPDVLDALLVELATKISGHRPCTRTRYAVGVGRIISKLVDEWEPKCADLIAVPGCNAA